MNEQLKALLESLELSEDTGTQIQTILTEAFAAAKEEGKKEAEEENEALKEELANIQAAHDIEVAYLKEQANEYGAFLKEQANEYGAFLKEKANAYGESIKESVASTLKEAADYAVDQFITENKERFVQTEQFERMQAAFDYIKEAFERNAFSVNEDLAVTELQESAKKAAAQYDALFEDFTAAREELDKVNRALLLERSTADLADTQKEKVNELLEAVSFDSFDEYKDGIAMIVEQAKAAAAPAVVVSPVVESQEGTLLENVEGKASKKAVDPSIAALMSRPGLF